MITQIIDEFGETVSPRDLAADWIHSALIGRMATLVTDDLPERLMHLTDEERDIVGAEINRQLDRLISYALKTVRKPKAPQK